jgi:hypothetical protein
MRFFIYFFLLFISKLHAQEIEVNWTDSFQKELHLSCHSGAMICEKICDAPFLCTIEEGLCHDCIGTSLKMYHIFSEIGRSIQRVISSPWEEFIIFILAKRFVTFTTKDAFNLIDGYNSLSVREKFESLCPDESLSQILFFEVHPISRKLDSPKYIYCSFQEHVEIYEARDSILIH